MMLKRLRNNITPKHLKGSRYKNMFRWGNFMDCC